MMSPWTVYILRCADGSLYTGIAKDVDRRRRQHAAGTASKYTRNRLPVKLVYREVQPDRGAALKRELASRYPSDRPRYTAEKSAFIEGVVRSYGQDSLAQRSKER